MELFHRRYKTHCEKALDDFSRVYWPCEFSKNGERCANSRAGHSKGHQDKCGNIIGSGDYESTFLSASFNKQWCNILEKHMRQSFENVGVGQQKRLKESHLRIIGDFYQGARDLLNSEEFQSHTVCLCCLGGYPEHPLRCGHILCIACIQLFSSNYENVTFKMMKCPLHDTNWQKPWPVTIMPPLAGGRILCLDG
jgi:hypothetical protein